MSDAYSSDNSSGSSPSDEPNRSSKGDSTTRVKKGDGNYSGRNKDEQKLNKNKQSNQNDYKHPSSDHLSTNRTNKSSKHKTRINEKSANNKSPRCDKNVKEPDDSPKMVHRKNDDGSTAGGSATLYDSPPHVKKSRSGKIKRSEKKQEKSFRDIVPENNFSKSKPNSTTTGNKLNSSNRKVALESCESETSESDNDTGKPELKRGKSSSKGTSNAGELFNCHNNSKVPSDENSSRDKHKTTEKSAKTNDSHENTMKKKDKCKEKIDNKGYGHDMHMGLNCAMDGARGTNVMTQSKKSNNSLMNSRSSSSSDKSSSCTSSGSSSNKNRVISSSRSPGASRRGISHDGSSSQSSCSSFSFVDNRSGNSSQGRHRGGTDKSTSDSRSKKFHDKKETESDRASTTNRREDTTDRTSDRKSKKSHDKTETESDRASSTSSREDTTDRTSNRKSEKSHDKSETESDRASTTSRRKGTTDRTSDRKSKKSHDKSENESDRASTTSRRKGTTDRTSDRVSKNSYYKTETESNRASTTSHREDDKSKKSHDERETDHKTKTKGKSTGPDGKNYGRGARQRSVSSRSSSDRKRFPSKEKSRDKMRPLVKGKHGSKHEQRNVDSERNHSSDDYNRKKKNSEKNTTDQHQNKSRERGKRGSKHEQRNVDSERNHRSDDYNRRKKNSERDTTDQHQKKSHDPYHHRHRSADRSKEKELTRRRKSSASSKDSGKSYDGDRKKYPDSCGRKSGYHRNYDNEDSFEREGKYAQSNYKYEWQFENEHGKWITYGLSVSGRPLQGADTVTSDEIEKFFSKPRDRKIPLRIEANGNQYELDFNHMSQINLKTLVCRRIRRLQKSDKHNYHSQKYDEDYRYSDAREYDLPSSHFGRLGDLRPDPKDNRPGSKKDSSTKFEWQFEDRSGNWITYGKTNSAKNRNNGSSTTSDDIEKFHTSDPTRVTMQIQSGRNQYLLNFKQMTQLNIETSSQRRVRRVSKSSSHGFIASLSQWLGLSSYWSSDRDVESYEWQFQDERGVWITYGHANSNGISAFSTMASSDEIEAYYSSSHDKAPISISSRTHTYVLDFKSMVQINQETSVQRLIRRVKKTSKDSNANQQGGAGQTGVTAGKGNTAGVYNFPNPSHNTGNFGFGVGNVPQGFYQDDPRVNVGAGQHINHSLFPCAWQFQDEHRNWITYGQPSSTNQTAGSTTTSDDIEQYFITNPGKTSMIIQSPSNQYVLDIQRMIQINQKTQAQKPVRRVMKQNGQPPPNVMMQNVQLPPNF